MLLSLTLLVSASLHAQTWAQLGIGIDGEANNDYSGVSVSLSADGSTLAIVAPFNAGGGLRRGHVRVYKNILGTWTQQGADIDGQADNDNSSFINYSVSLSADGSIVAIKATEKCVRVYKFNGTNWAQQGADIIRETYVSSVSLSADGSTVAIGALGSSQFDNFRGQVRVYKNISGSWTQQGADINGEADYDQLGFSVSLSADGSIVAIGANFSAGGGSQRGHVQVYKNISGTWTQQGANINGEADGDNSGTSVSISADGSVVAIGAYGNNGDRGHVRVYKNISGTWTQQGADIDGKVEGMPIGRQVSISADGNAVAFGGRYNYGYDPDFNDYIMGSYGRVYKNISGSWTQQGADIVGIRDGGAANSQLAISLSADGSTVAIGSPKYADDRGHVQVYRFICPAFSSTFNPICLVGNPLNLSISGGGDAYSWRGPNGFKSSSATPSKPKTVKADMGIYSVTLSMTSGIACTSSTTLSVFAGVGNITASSNSPVCNGGTIKLTASAQTPANFKWTKQFGTTTYNGATVNIGGAKPKDGGIYTVFITGENGCIVKKEVLVTVSALPCSGTRLANEEAEEIDMEINTYPNPTSKLLTVEVKLKEPSSLKLNLYNATGNSLTEWNLSEESTSHRKEIDMSVYKDGLYLLQAQSRDGRQSKRVVKVE